MTPCAVELLAGAQRDRIATKLEKILADFQAGVCLSLQAPRVIRKKQKDKRVRRNSDNPVLHFNILSLSLFIKYGAVESSVVNELKIK
jgi:hypothetical protein